MKMKKPCWAMHLNQDQGFGLFDFMDLGVGEEMQDDKMDCFVMQEGPNQMVNLLLEEQTDNIIYGELSNSKDFEDWI